MQAEERKVSELKPDEKNARVHDERNIESIAESLRQFGQQKPIVIDKENKIIAGNGTVEAAKSLKWKTVKVVVTELSSAKAVAFGIADNRTAELADWDREMLSLLMEDLPPDLLESTGFSENELTALISSSELESPGDFPEVDESIDVNNKCPKCGFVWSQ